MTDTNKQIPMTSVLVYGLISEVTYFENGTKAKREEIAERYISCFDEWREREIKASRIDTWDSGYDRAYWEMNPEAEFPPLSRNDYLKKIEANSLPITPEEIKELKSFEFYPHANKSLKVLGEDYEGQHFGKEDIERLILLLIKYVA